ncbi:zf-TFIIB domain-containing protein [[Archangium] primigenium]|uniref:TFIIB-type zinc ribbon-containing protein n=1 Tax=Melittangium TaxID=44 RepID=UPI00195E1104|nr:zf-TFIIB domain-containing protein [Archangium primigenium]MBM7118508.1 zf-TFIIB domain-containing protein [Archangium primigenium]
MSHIEKPSTPEEAYFQHEEIEKKRKLAFEQAQRLQIQQREELKALHYMKCPKCGLDLQPVVRADVEIDTCFNCHGIFLDAGELEVLQKQMKHENDGKWMGAVLNLFKNK